MSVDVLYSCTLALLSFAILFQVFVVFEASRRLKSGRPPPKWRWLVSVVVDVAIPITALTLLHLLSPRGTYAALSTPGLLGIPLVTMLSILRLKPRISLWTGLAGAAAHAALTTHAIGTASIDTHLWPMLYSYSVFLAFTAVAAWVVATQARANVTEAVAEAMTAEQSRRAMAEMEHDLNVARDIQQGLMPSSVPSIAGFDVAGMARPAQQTGGDYYDWQQLTDGRLLVVLADVTGHGIGPALVMAVCRAYARAAAPSAVDSAALLRQINMLIYEDLSQTGRFITMVIAILSPNGTVELVSAGHGPTMLYRRATGAVDVFGGDGIPLGIDADEKYGPHAVLRLEPGDALLLATDGFMEWLRAGDREQFGLERMEAAFKAGASGSAQAMLDGLDAAVKEFSCGEPQHDDTTAVAIKRL